MLAGFFGVLWVLRLRYSGTQCHACTFLGGLYLVMLWQVFKAYSVTQFLTHEEAAAHLKHDQAQDWKAFDLYPQPWILGQHVYSEVVQIPTIIHHHHITIGVSATLHKKL